MSNTPKLPYVLNDGFYQYNLQWLVNELLSFKSQLDSAIDLKTIHYADPLHWDITTQYAPNTVVVDQKTGTAYMSKQPVPAGILLTNTDYWVVVFNYQKIYEDIKSGIAPNEGDSLNASRDYLPTELIWYGNSLYRATRAIPEGSVLIPGTNITPATIAGMLATYYGRDRVAQVLTDTLNVSGTYKLTALNAIIEMDGDLTITAGDIAVNADNKTETFTGDVQQSGVNKTETFTGDVQQSGVNKTETFTGDVQQSGVNKTETFTGDVQQSGVNKTETFTGDASLKAKNLEVFLENPLQYGTPVDGLLPMLNDNGEAYNIITDAYKFNSVGISVKDICNTNGAVSFIGAVLESYIRHNGSLVYGNFNGAFNKQCTNQIDCSTLVQLCLMGVPYEQSRYNAGLSENISYSGYVFDDMTEYQNPDDDRPFGLLANELAKYAEDRGYLYAINDDLSNIRPGDVLFISNSPIESYYKHIGHCAIVLGTTDYPNKTVNVVAGHNQTPTIGMEYWNLTNSDVIYAARFPLPDVSTDIKNLINTRTTPKSRTLTLTNTNTSTPISLSMPEQLKAGEFYTIAFDTDLDLAYDAAHFTMYYYTGTSWKGFLTFRDGNEKKCFMPFLLPSDYTPSEIFNVYESLQLRCICANTQTSKSVNVSNIGLYKGIIVPDAECVSSIPPRSTFMQFTPEYIATNDTLDVLCKNLNFLNVPCIIKCNEVTTGVLAGASWYVLNFSFARNTGCQVYFPISVKSTPVIYARQLLNSNWSDFAQLTNV